MCNWQVFGLIPVIGRLPKADIRASVAQDTDALPEITAAGLSGILTRVPFLSPHADNATANQCERKFITFPLTVQKKSRALNQFNALDFK